MKANNSQNGFTLIEILAVIFVVTVGIAAVYSLVQNVMVSSRLASYQLRASYLAQEGTEIVRSVRDTNWLEAGTGSNEWDEGFPDPGGTSYYQVDYEDLGAVDPIDPSGNWVGNGDYLKVDGNGYHYGSGDRTPFKRKVTVTNDGDYLEVTVEVSFELKGQQHTVQTKELLYNWYQND